MFKILSYPIKDGDPTWPGNPTCSLEPHTSIAKGDTANTATIHLFNHYGTHLDGPMHFNPNGIGQSSRGTFLLSETSCDRRS